MDAVTTHGDVEDRTCRRRRCKLNSPVRWQIEHDHSIRHGADPAPEHVLATYEAGDIGGQRLGVHVIGGGLPDVESARPGASHHPKVFGQVEIIFFSTPTPAATARSYSTGTVAEFL